MDMRTLMKGNAMQLVPAYGRDYKSKKAVQADWDANLDFIAQPSGRYINKSGAKEAGLKTVYIRYKKLRSVTPVKV
jgi:hypothetical protein